MHDEELEGHDEGAELTPRTRAFHGKRTYTDDERANAVAQVAINGGNVYATAAQLGISETTLRQWVNGERARHILPVSEQKRLELADKFEDVLDLALRVVVEKIGDLNAHQAAIVAGIATDKRALLLGEATAITEHRTDDALDARTKRARERYGPRKLVPVKVVTPAQLPPAEGDAPATEGS